MNSRLLSESPNFKKLSQNYLFSEIREKTGTFLKNNGGEVINLGVGDVAFPIPRVAVTACTNAIKEMGDPSLFKGYPPEGGYDFLRKAIAENFYSSCDISPEEIFVSDGSKSDTANFTDIFDICDQLIANPVYPVYVDSAIMRGNNITFIKGTKENNFLPTPEGVERKPWIINLCSPNNPSGGAYSYKGLKQWVDFALETGSLILFDSAYSAFVSDGMPRTIFSIKGAKDCAVEFGSFSKFAGFTGMRCSWLAIPFANKCRKTRIIDLWRRRQSSKFNGVAYPVQRAAEAVLTQTGLEECASVIRIYKQNAHAISAFINSKGIWNTGSENSPYVWLECPKNFTSWQFFDYLLENYRIVGTPGCGFGEVGEGFFRISSFAKPQTVKMALERVEGLKSLRI